MDSYKIEQFMELENEVWTALVAGDAEVVLRLFADDFLGVYPSGFNGREEHLDQLGNGPTVAEFDLFHGRIQVLAEDVVLVTYRADWTPSSANGGGEIVRDFVTSIWRRHGGTWRNLFSQDTAADS